MQSPAFGLFHARAPACPQGDQKRQIMFVPGMRQGAIGARIPVINQCFAVAGLGGGEPVIDALVAGAALSRL